MWKSHNSSPKKIVEVTDRWVKVRVTMDSGAAGHVMPVATFPRVKLKRKTSPKKFVAANGEQIRDLGEKNMPFKTNEGIQRCMTFRSASVVKPIISMQNVVRGGNIVVLDKKNPPIRNIRDGTMIKLDVNNGVHTMDMWICLDETSPVFSWQGQSSGQTAFDQLVRQATLCKCEGAVHQKLEKIEETELNGVEEGQDEMSEETRARLEGEEALKAPDWRVRADHRNKPTRKERTARNNTRTDGVHVA